MATGVVAGKRSPLFWIGAALLTLAMLLGVLWTGIRYLIPPATGIEAVRIVVETNKDLEPVSEQDGGILVRSRSTGAYSLYRFNDSKQLIVLPVSAELVEKK